MNRIKTNIIKLLAAALLFGSFAVTVYSGFIYLIDRNITLNDCVWTLRSNSGNDKAYKFYVKSESHRPLRLGYLTLSRHASLALKTDIISEADAVNLKTSFIFREIYSIVYIDLAFKGKTPVTITLKEAKDSAQLLKTPCRCEIIAAGNSCAVYLNGSLYGVYPMTDNNSEQRSVFRMRSYESPVEIRGIDISLLRSGKLFLKIEERFRGLYSSMDYFKYFCAAAGILLAVYLFLLFPDMFNIYKYRSGKSRDLMIVLLPLMGFSCLLFPDVIQGIAEKLHMTWIDRSSMVLWFSLLVTAFLGSITRIFLNRHKDAGKPPVTIYAGFIAAALILTAFVSLRALISALGVIAVVTAYGAAAGYFSRQKKEEARCFFAYAYPSMIITDIFIVSIYLLRQDTGQRVTLFSSLAYFSYLCALYFIKRRLDIKYSQLFIILSFTLMLAGTEYTLLNSRLNYILDARWKGQDRDYLMDTDCGWVRPAMLDYGLYMKKYGSKYPASRADRSVICLGGSTTEAKVQASVFSGRYDYPYLLEKLLKEKNLHVYNFGVGGWTTHQIRTYFAHYYDKVMARTNPEVFIIYTGHNDVFNKVPRYTYRELYNARVKENSFVRLIKSLRLIGGLKNLASLLGYQFMPEYEVRGVPEAETVDNLKYIAGFIHEKNKKVIFISEATMPDFKSPDMDKMRETIRLTALNTGAFYLDPRNELSSRAGSVQNSIFYDQVHFNIRGNLMLADILAVFIKDNKLLPPLKEQ